MNTPHPQDDITTGETVKKNDGAQTHISTSTKPEQVCQGYPEDIFRLFLDGHSTYGLAALLWCNVKFDDFSESWTIQETFVLAIFMKLYTKATRLTLKP